MVNLEDLAQIEGLIDQLVEAERSITNLIGGEADAIVHPATAIPSLLHDAQRWLWNAEAHQQRVQEAVAVGILIVNAYGAITFANRVAQGLLSFTEDLLGTPYAARPWRLADKDGLEFAPGKDPIETALLTGKFVPSTTAALVDGTGEVWTWLLVTCEPVSAHPAGPVEEIVATVVDVTEQHAANDLAQRRADQQRSVVYLGELAAQGHDLKTVFDAAVAEVSQSLGVEYAELLELEANSRDFKFKAGCGWGPDVLKGGTVPTGGNSQAGYTLASTEPVIVADMRSETRFTSVMQRDRGIVSGITVLVPDGSEAFGVLGAHTTQKRSFTRDDINFLQTVANLLASVVQRSKSEETIRLLSTPVLPVKERLLLVPLVGVIDRDRSAQLTQDLLEAVREHRAKVVVLDITGVSFMDRFVAESLLYGIRASGLLGAQVIVTGVSVQATKTLVSLGIGLEGFMSAADLRSGLEMGERLLD